MKTYTICSALIVNKGKFLIAKRSPKKTFAPNEWEFISGFIDKEKKTVEEIMFDELKEELNISGQIIYSGTPFVSKDKYVRWIVIPFLIKTNAKGLRINEKDHTKLKWITKNEFTKYNNLDWFLKGFKKANLI